MNLSPNFLLLIFKPIMEKKKYQKNDGEAQAHLIKKALHISRKLGNNKTKEKAFFFSYSSLPLDLERFFGTTVVWVTWYHKRIKKMTCRVSSLIFQLFFIFLARVAVDDWLVTWMTWYLYCIEDFLLDMGKKWKERKVCIFLAKNVKLVKKLVQAQQRIKRKEIIGCFVEKEREKETKSR